MSAIKRGSKEFYDVMNAFEMHAKNSAIYVTDFTRVDRGDDKTPTCYFYENGKTNDLFHMFMCGYVSAKAEYEV